MLETQLYLEAAKRGNVNAQIRLAEKYFDGDGIPQSDLNALMWLNVAFERSPAMWFETTSVTDPVALSFPTRTEDITARMSSDEIVNARRRAEICLTSNYKDCD